MAEATIDSESGLYSLRRGGGRGMKIGGFHITVTDAETLDTGLDTIEGIASMDVEGTDVDGDTNKAYVASISGGTITFITGDIGDYTDGTDMEVYLIVMGKVK